MWSLTAEKSSPVTKVLKLLTEPRSTTAHFECDPGSTIRRPPESGDAENLDLLAADHVRLPGLVLVGEPGREMNRAVRPPRP